MITLRRTSTASPRRPVVATSAPGTALALHDDLVLTLRALPSGPPADRAS